jgi:hypothetical protein
VQIVARKLLQEKRFAAPAGGKAAGSGLEGPQFRAGEVRRNIVSVNNLQGVVC